MFSTIMYSTLEGWSILDSLYATIITITTVGYGDFSPQTTAGKIFAIVFTLGAIGIGGYALSELAASVIERQATRLERKLRSRRMNQIANLEDHVIICGTNSISLTIAKECRRSSVKFILVSQDEKALHNAMLWLHDEYFQQRLESMFNIAQFDNALEQLSLEELAETVNVPYIADDPGIDEVLVRARLEKARGLITTLDDDRDNMFIVVGAKALAQRLGNEKLRIMSRSSSQDNVRKLYMAGADHVRRPEVFGGYHMVSAFLHPEINLFLDRLLLMEDGEDLIRFQDLFTSKRPELVGKTVAQLKEEYNQVVLGIKRGEETVTIPPSDFVIQADDIVFVLGGNMHKNT